MATRLQLHLSAKDLKAPSSSLLFHKKKKPPDTFAVVTVRGDQPQNAPQVVGQTNV